MYLRGDPYESSDAVFGVKDSLVVDLTKVTDEATAQKYGVEVGCRLLKYDFVLVTKEETMALREKNAREAMLAQGRNMLFVDGLPVPDVD